MGGQGAARHHLVTEGAGEVLLWDFCRAANPSSTRPSRRAGAALLVAKGVHERQNSCVFTCFVTLMYTFCRGAPLLQRAFHGALIVLACSMVTPAADSKLPTRCVWV